MISIEKAFEFIENKKTKIKLCGDEIKILESEIDSIALNLLKEQHGIEIGCQYENSGKIFKITRIIPSQQFNHISYCLSGNPMKKDGEFSKKEWFIHYLYIEKEGRI